MSRRLPLAEEGDEYLAVEQVVLEMEMGKPVVSSSKVSLVRKLAFPPSSVSADSNFPDAERALVLKTCSGSSRTSVARPGNLLEMQILQHCRPTEYGASGVGSASWFQQALQVTVMLAKVGNL